MTLIVRPGFQFDTDASTYIEAVEVADTQALETATRYAINDFVIGCKQDGIWSAIKASCILAGARTLTGALVPLVGTAPTNNNFVSGDYNRKTGLVGNGSTKYLNSNRNNNADPQNNRHLAVYVKSQTTNSAFLASQSTFNVGGDTYIFQEGTSISTRRVFLRSSSSATTSFDPLAGGTGLFAVTRSNSSTLSYCFNGSTTSASDTSATPLNGNTQIFGAPSFYTNARLAFYSIGESLDLALLDARVSALITAFGVAIP
jgi:hypothetical protein